MKNSGTINQLREHAKSEWEIWQEVAGTHEYTLYEQEQQATDSAATADAEGSAT